MYDVIVIGGGPAGIISAVTIRQYNPNKKILLIKSIGNGVIPCAIPYMLKTLEKPEDNYLGNAVLEKNGVSIKVDEVISINTKLKEITTRNNEKLRYKKLVIATGSSPITLYIPGKEKKGIYTIQKEMNHLKALKQDVYNSKNVVVIGGGFIGAEFADELSDIEGIKVTLVELEKELLRWSFDPEFSDKIEQELLEKGVNVLTGKGVERFEGGERVEVAILSDGKKIPAEVAILGVGAKPNSSIAKQAGIKTSKHGGIVVDEFLRTSNQDVFAVGDCAEKKCFFTKKPIEAMLASTATTEARIAGANVFNPRIKSKIKGIVRIYSTKISGIIFASAGLTEQAAGKQDFKILVGRAEGVDKHPAKMPNASKMKVKLVFSKKSGKLLGGQIMGGGSSGELINVIGMGIQKQVLINELVNLQIGTHPKLTPSPTAYLIIKAAQDALNKFINNH